MKALTILIFSFIPTIFHFSASDQNQEAVIIEIRFGTSFGKCSGYCIQEVTFTEKNVNKKLIPHRDKSLDVKTCNQDFSEFNTLASLVDIESFDQLEVTIGCPDCADGGAEWVQVFTSEGYDKKVTYSYNKEPEAMTPYISILREYYESIGQCD